MNQYTIKHFLCSLFPSTAKVPMAGQRICERILTQSVDTIVPPKTLLPTAYLKMFMLATIHNSYICLLLINNIATAPLYFDDNQFLLLISSTTVATQASKAIC